MSWRTNLNSPLNSSATYSGGYDLLSPGMALHFSSTPLGPLPRTSNSIQTHHPQLVLVPSGMGHGCSKDGHNTSNTIPWSGKNCMPLLLHVKHGENIGLKSASFSTAITWRSYTYYGCAGVLHILCTVQATYPTCIWAHHPILLCWPQSMRLIRYDQGISVNRLFHIENHYPSIIISAHWGMNCSRLILPPFPIKFMESEESLCYISHWGSNFPHLSTYCKAACEHRVVQVSFTEVRIVLTSTHMNKVIKGRASVTEVWIVLASAFTLLVGCIVVYDMALELVLYSIYAASFI